MILKESAEADIQEKVLEEREAQLIKAKKNIIGQVEGIGQSKDEMDKDLLKRLR